MSEIRAIPVPVVAEIKPGEKLADLILSSLKTARVVLQRGDLLVVTHKIVSKSEGQIVPLESVHPSASTKRWAKQYGLDARVVQLGLNESSAVIRRKNGVTITETKHGFICANSGVDASNVDGGHSAVLLPRDPDGSARSLHRQLKNRLGFSVPIIISDSFGRAWREGLTEVAIGLAGMKPFRDSRSLRDSSGYLLRVTIEAIADELACLAGLACGKLSRSPLCLIRGFQYEPARGNARELLRPAERDLFR